MYTLIIEDNHGRSAAEISFDQGSYTIGRVDGNDVVLASSSVSRSHARIFVSNNKCYIDDLGSANGVFVDGDKIRERTEIRNGSKIRIGEYTLYLEYKDQDLNSAGQDVLKTQIVSGGQSGYKIVRVMDKFAGEEFMLSEASNSIGRTEDNYILLSDQSISRNHAKIVNKGMAFFVTDLDSSNGTFVNNKKVSGECQLAPNDLVRFGNVSFVFVPTAQRVDITQYARKKSNDSRTFILFFTVLIVIIIGVIIVGGILITKKNSSDDAIAKQNELSIEEARAEFNKQLEKAATLYEDNEFSAAKEIIDALQKDLAEPPKAADLNRQKLIDLNTQVNLEILNKTFIQKGDEALELKKYEDAINEFMKVESDSKVYKVAREKIAETKRKQRLAAYNEARSDCDSGFSAECIRKLCDATLALEHSPSEDDKFDEAVELMQRLSKNRKNKYAAAAKTCYVSLRERN